MQRSEIEQYRDTYRNGLLADTLPFWTGHCVDREHGGFLFALARDGTVYNTDKPVWVHGRFVWLLSTLYTTVEQRPEWLELANHGLKFLLKHAFDTDGRMYFLLDRQGRPLRKRRYLFSEVFATMALAAYAKATHDDAIARRAVDLFKLMVRYHTTPGLLPPKWNPETRRMKGLVMPMVFISTAQVLRETIADPVCDEWIERSVDDIERDFMKPQFKAALEVLNDDGSFLDTMEGRLLCPGHAIECAWFILHEAKLRGDERMKRIGLQILDWMWDWGWDQEYGGIIYYRDVLHKPCTEYWHDMKFWWPQNETIIATLLAYQMTGDARYAQMHRKCHEWAYRHFPDREHGEWFGYLHRDGRISTDLKGNSWKGPFHLPRMQWYCWQICEQMLASAPAKTAATC